MASIGYPDNSASLAAGSGRGRATVAMGFVTGMLAGLVGSGGDPAPLLAATGIDAADADGTLREWKAAAVAA